MLEPAIGRPGAPRRHPSTLRTGIVDMTDDRGQTSLAYDWSHGRTLVDGRAQLEPLDGCDQSGEELVVNLLLHDYTRGSCASLARLFEPTIDDSGDGHVKVGIREHGSRVLSA